MKTSVGAGIALLSCLGLAWTDQQEQFRASTALVRLDVSVTDERGAIRGLTRRDFVVEDRGALRDVRVEEVADAPLDIVLVVPPLESVDLISRDQTPRVAAGIYALLERVRDSDRLAVLLAGTPPTLLRSMEFGGTILDNQAFTKGLYAAPFDAIVAGLGQFTESDRRRALVAFTNAADFRSTVTFDALTTIAGRLGPSFVLLGTPVKVQEEVLARAVSGGGAQIGDMVAAELTGYVFPAKLRVLARRTGGISINLGSGRPSDVMDAMFTWLRTYYVLSYQPTADKGWHSVTIKVNRRNARVTAREGYFIN